MPGYITHYLFGRQALSLPVVKESYPNFRKLIQNHAHVFNIGTQGPDLFLYLLQSNLNSKKKLGSIMHHTKSDVFFQTCLDYLSNANSNSIKDVFCAYFAGMLCHYTLDCYAHPYIYWKTGYRIDKPDNLAYLAKHCQFESDLDYAMLQRTCGCLPSKFKRDKYIKLKEEDINLLSKALSETISKTYYLHETAYTTPSFMKLALKYMPYKVHFLNDKGGPKRKVIAAVEKKTIKSPILSSLFTVDHITDLDGVLNLNRSPWKNPWNLNTTYHTSFLELYKDSLLVIGKRLHLLAAFYDSLSVLSSNYAKTTILKEDLLEELGDYSYNTGLSWRLNL